MTTKRRGKEGQSQAKPLQAENIGKIEWSTDVEGKPEKLKPFIDAMAELLDKDLLRNPPK